MKKVTKSKRGESPSLISIMDVILLDVKKQIIMGYDNIIAGDFDEESSKLKYSKHVFGNIVRAIVEHRYSSYLTFDHFDEDWMVWFEITDFQIQRRDAIRKLAELNTKGTVYIEDYMHLIIAGDNGRKIGEVTEVEKDQIDEAASIVRIFNIFEGPIEMSYKNLVKASKKAFRA